MTRYRYSGPVSSVRLADGTHRRLMPGAELELPEGEARVRVLVSRRMLTALEAAPRTGPVRSRGGRSSSRTVQPVEPAPMALELSPPSTESTE